MYTLRRPSADNLDGDAASMITDPGGCILARGGAAPAGTLRTSTSCTHLWSFWRALRDASVLVAATANHYIWELVGCQRQ